MIGRPVRKQPAPALRELLARGHLQLVLLAVILASFSLLISGLFALRAYAQQNVALLAQTLSYTVEPALVFDDREAARQMLGRLASNDNIAWVEIRDGAGQTFLRWHREVADPSDLGAVTAQWLGLAPVERQIVFRGKVIGTVRVAGGLGAIYRYTLASLVIASACLGITVIATRLLARRLEEAVAAPLDRIVEIADDVIHRRHLSRRLEPPGIAEIDHFAKDFNLLLTEFERWQETLSTENAELSRRVDRDPLTGLGNRGRFEKYLTAAISKVATNGGQVVVFYCDCNSFKQINDTHGHDIGDLTLCHVADTLRSVAQDPDSVFRLGGDEFAMVCETSNAAALVARTRGALIGATSAPVTVTQEARLHIGISVGHAIFPDDGQTLQQLMRVADSRMYRQKRGEIAS
ncbi:diguanylate cyclase domain-containing protein [Erythrobacter cryptus]|uniref:diguanylate cyclase domain-containing protein n=1 Tax=Erythrobacter cryptus TaxID=196588 RepID=UPI00041E80EA|nr:diguanylate cyclase [Erythrobacter cryptus]